MTDQFIKLTVSQLRSHPQNIRRFYNGAGIRELADSIAAHAGLIQPLVVMPNPDEAGTYLVIVGNRRYRAGVLLGESCPLLDARVETDIERAAQLLMMVSENLQREDPDPISEALHYRLLMQQEHLSMAEIAHRTGVSSARVSNTLLLLDLPDAIQQLIGEGKLQRDPRVAKALLSIDDAGTRLTLAERFAADGATIPAILKVCEKVIERQPARTTPVRPIGRPSLRPVSSAQPMLHHAQAKGDVMPVAGSPAWNNVRAAAAQMCTACNAFTADLRARARAGLGHAAPGRRRHLQNLRPAGIREGLRELPRRAAPAPADSNRGEAMTTIDIDTLVAEGYIAAGVKPSVVAKRSEAGRQLVERLQLTERARAQRVTASVSRWTAYDDAFLLANYRYIGEVEIARHLGRTQNAVHIRLKKLRAPGPSKHPEELTARKIEHMLGAELHAVCHWIDSGSLPGRMMLGGRNIRLVKRVTLLRWCITPENWLRFDVRRVRDPHIKRLIELRQTRWGDEWWSTTQVAAYHNTSVANVNARIQRRTLIPAKAVNMSGRHGAPGWSHNYILKSDAVKLRFTSGKGSATRMHIPPALDQFIVRAIGAGVPQVCLAKMIGWSAKLLAYWLNSRKGGAASVPFVDWRTVPHMPFVRCAVAHFINGQRLSYDQQLVVRGVLQAFCRHYNIRDRGQSRGRISSDSLRRLWQSLCEAGVDSFGMSHQFAFQKEEA